MGNPGASGFSFRGCFFGYGIAGPQLWSELGGVELRIRDFVDTAVDDNCHVLCTPGEEDHKSPRVLENSRYLFLEFGGIGG